MPVHIKVDADILARYGIQIDPVLFEQKYAGARSEDIIKDIFRINGKNLTPEILQEIMTEKKNLIHYYSSMTFRPIPGIIEICKKFEGKYRMAVGSGADKDFIIESLQHLKIDGYFSAIASTQEVKDGKPSPDVFLLAANRIGIGPKDCVVIEDGINGMIAAKQAGMKCIALVRYSANLDIYPADKIIRSLDELTPDLISSL